METLTTLPVRTSITFWKRVSKHPGLSPLEPRGWALWELMVLSAGWRGVDQMNTCAKLAVTEGSSVPVLRQLAVSQLGSTGEQELRVQRDESHHGKGRAGHSRQRAQLFHWARWENMAGPGEAALGVFAGLTRSAGLTRGLSCLPGHPPPTPGQCPHPSGATQRQ